VRRQPSNQLQSMVYKDLQRNFFSTLRKKVLTPESQTRMESANIQIRYVQSRILYASITRIESKQSNTNQKNQETQEKITIPSPK